MGQIFASANIRNVAEPGYSRTFDTLVDSGASHITLPADWKAHFGSFQVEQEVDLETTTQEITRNLVCGPARILVEGFRVIHGEVIFIDMKPADGKYEPLIGHIPLEHCGAAVD